MKKIKYVFELIFTFILPILALLLCFEVKTVNTVDENNNIISTEKEYNFKDYEFFNSEVIRYIKYNYKTDSVYLQPNESIMVNYNKAPFVEWENYYLFLFYDYNDLTYRVLYYNGSYINTSAESGFKVTFLNDYVEITNLGTTTQLFDNVSQNIIDSIEVKEMKENFISRLLHELFESLGIESNVIIEVLIIYLLLVMIMFIFWNVIYYPLTLLFNIMLWKKEVF